jgi:hypothetical protein
VACDHRDSAWRKSQSQRDNVGPSSGPRPRPRPGTSTGRPGSSSTHLFGTGRGRHRDGRGDGHEEPRSRVASCGVGRARAGTGLVAEAGRTRGPGRTRDRASLRPGRKPESRSFHWRHSRHGSGAHRRLLSDSPDVSSRGRWPDGDGAEGISEIHHDGFIPGVIERSSQDTPVQLGPPVKMSLAEARRPS